MRRYTWCQTWACQSYSAQFMSRCFGPNVLPRSQILWLADVAGPYSTVFSPARFQFQIGPSFQSSITYKAAVKSRLSGWVLGGPLFCASRVKWRNSRVSIKIQKLLMSSKIGPKRHFHSAAFTRDQEHEWESCQSHLEWLSRHTSCSCSVMKVLSSEDWTQSPWGVLWGCAMNACICCSWNEKTVSHTNGSDICFCHRWDELESCYWDNAGFEMGDFWTRLQCPVCPLQPISNLCFSQNMLPCAPMLLLLHIWAASNLGALRLHLSPACQSLMSTEGDNLREELPLSLVHIQACRSELVANLLSTVSFSNRFIAQSVFLDLGKPAWILASIVNSLQPVSICSCSLAVPYLGAWHQVHEHI